MLTKKVFGNCIFHLRKVIADFIKHICINETNFQNNATPFETYIAGRLVPLDQNPGLQPIDVGEVLRRIAGKATMSIVRNDVTQAVRNLLWWTRFKM